MAGIYITTAFKVTSEPTVVKVVNPVSCQSYNKLKYTAVPLFDLEQTNYDLLDLFNCNIFVRDDKYTKEKGLVVGSVVYGSFAMALETYSFGDNVIADWNLSPIEYVVFPEEFSALVENSPTSIFQPMVYGFSKKLTPTVRTSKAGKDFMSLYIPAEVNRNLIGTFNTEVKKVPIQSVWWRVEDESKLTDVPVIFSGVLTGFNFYRSKDGNVMSNLQVRLVELEPIKGYETTGSTSYNTSGSKFNKGKTKAASLFGAKPKAQKSLLDDFPSIEDLGLDNLPM